MSMDLWHTMSGRPPPYPCLGIEESNIKTAQQTVLTGPHFPDHAMLIEAIRSKHGDGLGVLPPDVTVAPEWLRAEDERRAPTASEDSEH